MATKTQKKKHTRKTRKRYELVTFESSLFDGEFTLPNQAQMPLGVVEGVQSGAIGKMTAWLEAAGTEDADIDAFRELSGEELETFIREWGEGQLANAPKSGA